MTKPDQQWEKFVRAARKAPPESGDDDTPPRGFISGIVGFRDAIANFARTLAWRRWSILVALLSGIVLLVAFALTRCDEDRVPLIAPPTTTSLLP